MSDSLWAHELQHAKLRCPSLSPWVSSDSCPLSQWCHPTISSSVVLFSPHPQSFPASGSFSISSTNPHSICFLATSDLSLLVCPCALWSSYTALFKGFPVGASGKESAFQWCRRHGFNLWIGKISWRRKWKPSPVFLPRESHGKRSLAGYSPWGCKKLDTTECLSTHPPQTFQAPIFLKAFTFSVPTPRHYFYRQLLAICHTSFRCFLNFNCHFSKIPPNTLTKTVVPSLVTPFPFSYLLCPHQTYCIFYLFFLLFSLFLPRI